MGDLLGDLRGVYRDFYGKDSAMPDDDHLMDMLLGEQSKELLKDLDDQLARTGANPLGRPAASGYVKVTEQGNEIVHGPGKTPPLPDKDLHPKDGGNYSRPVDGGETKNPQIEGGQSEAEEQAEPPRPAIEELNELVGLTDVKHDVAELVALAKVKKLREEKGLKPVPVSLHLVFSGNPGTGKTTVARILARLYQEIGILSKGQLVEVDRSALVAGYVGQTAIKTQEKIQEALGGILFIDEAYALTEDDRDSFGQECVNTILKGMEDHRDDLIVIVAGYTEPMKKFVESNPGLKSRFNKYFEFPDYSAEELQKIFVSQCERYQYEITEDALAKVNELIVKMEANKGENFANARSVRNLFESIITNQATRVTELEDPSNEDLLTITIDDLNDVSLPKDAVDDDDTGVDDEACHDQQID